MPCSTAGGRSQGSIGVPNRIGQVRPKQQDRRKTFSKQWSINKRNTVRYKGPRQVLSLDMEPSCFPYKSSRPHEILEMENSKTRWSYKTNTKPEVCQTRFGPGSDWTNVGRHHGYSDSMRRHVTTPSVAGQPRVPRCSRTGKPLVSRATYI